MATGPETPIALGRNEASIFRLLINSAAKRRPSSVVLFAYIRSEIISPVDASGSSGKESNMDMISSTLTALFSPLRESLSHFRKSCEGVGSSCLGVDIAGLVVTPMVVARVAPEPLTRTDDEDPWILDVGVTVVATGRVGGIAAADGLPLGPTVVHALGWEAGGTLVVLSA